MAISDEGDFQLIASEQMGNSAPTPRGTEWGQQHERLWRQILLPDGELPRTPWASLLRPRAEEEVELVGTGRNKGGVIYLYCRKLLGLW